MLGDMVRVSDGHGRADPAAGRGARRDAAGPLRREGREPRLAGEPRPRRSATSTRATWRRSAGRRPWAEIKGVQLTGRSPGWAGSSIHLFYLIGLQNRFLVFIRWTVSFITRGRGARLITGEAPRSERRRRRPPRGGARRAGAGRARRGVGRGARRAARLLARGGAPPRGGAAPRGTAVAGEQDGYRLPGRRPGRPRPGRPAAGAPAGRAREWRAETGSTNDDLTALGARRRARRGRSWAPTARAPGRGRRGALAGGARPRPAGLGAAAPPVAPVEAGLAPIVVGRGRGGGPRRSDARIVWPNDILIGGRKVAGASSARCRPTRSGLGGFFAPTNP